jgi:hypothetical protein
MALDRSKWTTPRGLTIDIVFARVTEPFGTIPVGTYVVYNCCGTAKERYAAFGRPDQWTDSGRDPY